MPLLGRGLKPGIVSEIALATFGPSASSWCSERLKNPQAGYRDPLGGGSHDRAAAGQRQPLKLSSKRAEVRLESPIPIFSNLEMLLTGTEGKRVDGSLQCKVASAVADSNKRFLVHFTSMSPAVETFIRGLVGQTLESKAGDRAPRRSAGSIAEHLRSQ
jgi:hypothetical protein